MYSVCVCERDWGGGGLSRSRGYVQCVCVSEMVGGGGGD